MPKLKRLSINELLKIFRLFGFELASQRGSHIKLRRKSPQGYHQILIVPRHRELDLGTIHAIYRQALKYISEQELFDYFYRK